MDGARSVARTCKVAGADKNETPEPRLSRAIPPWVRGFFTNRQA